MLVKIKPQFEFAPYYLSGVVYGTLLNHKPAIEALGDSVNTAPYKAAPKAPVLYVKPRNTISHDGANVYVPTDTSLLQVGAALGVVIGKTACRLTLDSALEYVAGYTVVNDVSVPHDSFYRPSIRFKAHDGFCPISHHVVPAAQVIDPNNLAVKVMVDGVCVHQTNTGGRVRDIQQLLVDVTDFMTLQAGDVLMIGVSNNAPLVKAGQLVEIEIESVGHLSNSFVIAQAKVQGVKA